MEISGRLVARNAALNIAGQSFPLIVGVIAIPPIIKGMGVEQFGLLSLAWIILGYFSVFDLGLGRAAARHIAEALGRGDREQVPVLAWTTVAVQAFFGLAAAIVLILIAPTLAVRVLRVPEHFAKDMVVIFRLLALAIPIIFVSGSFRGILEATQRFAQVNVVNALGVSSMFAAPAIAMGFHLALPHIVGVLILLRAAILVAYIMLVLRSVKLNIPRTGLQSRRVIKLIFSYGIWIMIFNALMPVYMYLDRFLITMLRGPSELSYYVVPYEVATRALIIPSGVVLALFPAFSTLQGENKSERIWALFRQSWVTVIAVLGPLMALIAVLAKPGLSIWISPEFAASSAAILRVLAVGVLLSAVGYVPLTLVQSVGRADVPAKYHLAELPVYGVVAFLMIRQWGAMGAAWAWVLRLIWTIPIFSWISIRTSSLALQKSLPHA